MKTITPNVQASQDSFNLSHAHSTKQTGQYYLKWPIPASMHYTSVELRLCPHCERERHGTKVELGELLLASWALFLCKLEKDTCYARHSCTVNNLPNCTQWSLVRKWKTIYFLHKQELKEGMLVFWLVLALALQIRSQCGGNMVFVLTFCQVLFILQGNTIVGHVLILSFFI